MKRTIKIKIESDILKKTVEQYFKAYKFCIETGYNLHTSSKKKIHNVTYKEIRNRYPNIPSALVQTVRDVACENLWAVKLKTKPIPKNKFIRYDTRTFEFRKKDSLVSLSTIEGRQKISIRIPEYFRKYLDWNCKSATVTLRKNQLWLSIIMETKTPEKKQDKTYIGLDRGIKNIAVSSDNKFYNSKKLKKVKGNYQHLKAVLQSKGTRSAKRKLKKLSGKEKRFVRDMNHCLSKEVASKDFTNFCLEDLKIRKEKKLGRKFNKLLGSWSFGQFQQFLDYKLEEQSKTLLLVNPCYTSQRCSVCGNIGKSNRQGSNFKCKNCGFELNADLNAARNIVYLGISKIDRLNVIQPNVTS
jgi:IS605 OrfB family transposase